MSGRAARILGSAVVASVALVVSPGGTTAASASDEGGAGSSIVVRGTALPDGQPVRLAMTGCAALTPVAGTSLTVAPGVRPGMAGRGNRSLGFRRPGNAPDGTAAGAMFVVPSLLGTTAASVRVDAPAGTTGVAYAAYQEAVDVGSQRFWVGRHDLAVGQGWQAVDARALTYDWTKVDLATGAAVTPRRTGTGTVDDFAGAAGSTTGGLYTIGFGCDGKPFALDMLQYGSATGTTTYDLEGPNDPKADADEQADGEGEDAARPDGQQDASRTKPTPAAAPTQDQAATEQAPSEQAPGEEATAQDDSGPAKDPAKVPAPTDEPEPEDGGDATSTPPVEESLPPAEQGDPSDGKAARTTTSEAPADGS